ncbi:transcriptional regulator [Virgibacillus subterraneus]|uniref:Transcriptional regulator n=1 Tax=Virgibacillus subterraneus TaxID=621109 RepID=A0A1H8Z065_9BACI|nr:helix-turn-helix transcriptional regulator [Virgibacillus subterraneus]SEP57810.1 transcriptional regulator [Virgibacillus subterraneus]
MEKKNEVFGKRLKELRDRKGLSQEKMSEALGISRARYSHYENNHVEPDIELIRKIANYHKVDSDYILGITDIPSREENAEIEKILNDPQTELMFNDWKNMSEEERKEAIEMIKYIKFKNKRGD